MAIDNPGVIDAIGTDRITGAIVLTVSDHLDWTEERHHLRVLQDKLNAYLDFIQSGQLSEDYPDAGDATLRIEVIAKHLAPPSAGWFFQKTNEALRQNDVAFDYKPLPDGY